MYVKFHRWADRSEVDKVPIWINSRRVISISPSTGNGSFLHLNDDTTLYLVEPPHEVAAELSKAAK